MERESDILIAGAGAVGLACAYFLNRTGRSVRIIDVSKVGSGTSYRNCGLITPSHAAPMCTPGNLKAAARSLFDPGAPLRVHPRLDLDFLAWVGRYSAQCTRRRAEEVMAAKARLLKASRQLTEKLIAKEQLDCQWSKAGLLAVASSEGGMEELRELSEQAAVNGVEAQVLNAAETRQLEPALLDAVVGGVRFPGDGMFRPEQFCKELARVCVEKGVSIHEDTEIKHLRFTDGQFDSLRTSRGVFEAPILIVAAGVWSRALMKKISVNVPIEPGKGYTLSCARPDPCPRQALLLQERRIAVTPWKDGFRLGGTMEFTGLDPRIDKKRIGALIEGAAEYLIEPIAPGKPQSWCGFRPMTPDDLPLIGPISERQGVFLACGHNMMGMSMSVATGRLITELVAGAKPHLDPSPYAPKRFSEQPANPIVAGWRLVRDRIQSRMSSSGST